MFRKPSIEEEWRCPLYDLEGEERKYDGAEISRKTRELEKLSEWKGYRLKKRIERLEHGGLSLRSNISFRL